MDRDKVGTSSLDTGAQLTSHDLEEYENYKSKFRQLLTRVEKLLLVQQPGGLGALGNDEEDVLSSSSSEGEPRQRLGDDDDFDDRGILGEDSCEEEDFEPRYPHDATNLSIKPDRPKKVDNGPYQPLSSSALTKSHKMILTNNDDITFLNNGNVEATSSSKNIATLGEQDSVSTKVEAESERGEKTSKKASKRRTKSKTEDVIVEEEAEINKKKRRKHHKKRLIMNVA